MTLLALLKATLKQLLSKSRSDRHQREMIVDEENGTSQTDEIYHRRDFDKDYYAASAMLKQRMKNVYPDNFHVRLGNTNNLSYDYGEKRTQAVDTASTAIANALREGATVQEAAEAGAVSVGI